MSLASSPHHLRAAAGPNPRPLPDAGRGAWLGASAARTRLALCSVAFAAAALGAVGCDDSASEPAPGTAASASPAASTTRRVPQEYGTIQEAVYAAEPGDLVLISPGVYREAVRVHTPNLTIRGTERNTVILDGEFNEANAILVSRADGVAIENMTARNYTANGFFWNGATGYRGSYLTTYRIGDYGIYAFNSVRGQLDHSYASGSPDAGFYVGECYPCDALVTDVLSEYNGLGYSGTNAGGNLIITNSVFRFNRAGIVPNTGTYELCYPQRGTTIAGNLVYSNNQADTPAIEIALLGMGNGILVAGGTMNTIVRNRVYDHDKTGIGLVVLPEDSPKDLVPPDADLTRPCDDVRKTPLPADASLPDLILWHPRQNRVIGNVVEDSRLADLAVGSVGVDVATLGNCFAGNDAASSAPLEIERLAPCEGSGTGDWSAGALDLLPWASEQQPASADYKTSPVPPDQPNMPDAETAPARPATDLLPSTDIDAITVPAKP